MKTERTKNATRNIVFGVTLKMYQIIVPFFMRSAMIYCMGDQYLGLTSLFKSILQVLNLVELGVGSAMVYSMYKPIHEDDTDMICALLKLYRTYYRIIGIVIGVIGVALIPFLPYLVSGDIPPELDLTILYLLNLGTTVLSYWLFAYKNSLLVAHQRTDLSSKVQLITNTLQFLAQLLIIIFIKDFYLYLIAALATQAVSNIATALIAQKFYPQYRPQGKLPKEKIKQINRRVKDLFTSKVGGVILNSADTIVISAFLGLTVLSYYQNYFFILTSVAGIVTTILNSCTASIGNSIIADTPEKNFNDFKKFSFIIAWLAGFCTCSMLCLYQPFIEIWLGQERMLPMATVVCLCIYYFLLEINQFLNLYKDAAGMWHEDRFRPLVTASCNLIMNLIMVQFWGLYGVILSTVIAMLFVGMPWLLHNLFTVMFDKSNLLGYVKVLLKYTVFSAAICFGVYMACSFVNAGNVGIYLTFLIRGVICVVAVNGLYFLLYRKTKEFADSKELVKRIFKRKKAGR